MLQCLMAKVKKTQKKVQIVNLLSVTEFNFDNNYICVCRCTFTFYTKENLSLDT